MAGTIGFVIGFIACAVIIIGISVIVALDNDNEYLDYPSEGEDKKS